MVLFELGSNRSRAQVKDLKKLNRKDEFWKKKNCVRGGMAALPQSWSNSKLLCEGGPDYAANIGVRRQQDGFKLMYFKATQACKARWYLKKKGMNWTELSV